MIKPIPPNAPFAPFWTNVDVGAMHKCWPWKPRANTAGYGTTRIAGKAYRAHRVAYTLIRGAIPDGLVIDHLCRNKLCCNPWHLEAVTQTENVQRGAAMKRPRNSSVHGTTTGYAYGCRCDECRAANAKYTLSYRQSKPPKVRRQRVLVHGTLTGYSYGCRCELCRASQVEHQRAYRARRRLTSA